MTRFLFLKISIIIFVLISSSCKNEPLNKWDFTMYYLNKERNYFYIGTDVIIGDSIEIEYEDCSFTNLSNAYKQYCLQPANLDTIVQVYINAKINDIAFDIAKDFKLHNLIPLLKQNDYIDRTIKTAIEFGYPNQQFSFQQYNDSLIIVYFLDSPTGFSLLDKEFLDSLSIPQPVLYNIALQNLKDVANEYSIHDHENNIYQIYINGFYESNLLQIEEFFYKEDFPVKGEFVVGIPNRQSLYITGSEEIVAIDTLKKWIQKEFHTVNHPISTSLYKWNGEIFEVFNK